MLHTGTTSVGFPTIGDAATALVGAGRDTETGLGGTAITGVATTVATGGAANSSLLFVPTAVAASVATGGGAKAIGRPLIVEAFSARSAAGVTIPRSRLARVFPTEAAGMTGHGRCTAVSVSAAALLE